MIKKFSLLFILLISSLLIAQSIPNNFTLTKNKSRSKILSDSAPIGNSVEFIKFMGTDVWIGTSIGLSKSSDGGETWENYTFDDDGISALGIKNDTIWAATWHLGNYPNAADDDAVGSGLHYSVDKGETWIDIDQPQDALTDTVIKYGNNELRNLVWANPVYNLTRSIDFQNNTIWIANYFAGVYKSDNLGKTWKKVVLPPDDLNEITPDSSYDFTLSSNESSLSGFVANLNHVIFSLKVINDSTIAVGTAGGINISTDGGISWKKFTHLNEQNPISGNRILRIDYDYYRNTIWAATWQAAGSSEFYGLSSSSDMGKNWETFLAGENVQDIDFTYDSDGNEDNILAATQSGVFRSPDSGSTWSIAPLMKDDNTNVVLNSSKFRAVNSVQENGVNNIWFGTEAGASLLKETDGLWKGSWKVFLSSPGIAQNSEAIAFPNPFKPDEERINIKYSFQGENQPVTIRIFDFGMNLVKTIIQNANRRGGTENIDNWNGRDENNKIVPNGVYFFRIDIGNNDPTFGKIMVLM